MAVRRLHHGRCILLIPYVRRNKYLHSLNKAQRKTVLKSWLCVAVRICSDWHLKGEEMELIPCLQDIDFVQVRYK